MWRCASEYVPTLLIVFWFHSKWRYTQILRHLGRLPNSSKFFIMVSYNEVSRGHTRFQISPFQVNAEGVWSEKQILRMFWFIKFLDSFIFFQLIHLIRLKIWIWDELRIAIWALELASKLTQNGRCLKIWREFEEP